MLKKKKIFIGVLGASVLLIAGSNLAINYMIDRQKINDQLSEIIEKKTGRKVHLNHLSLQLVPWPEIKASDIALENIKDGKADYFIHAGKFSAKINLLSLLKKNINIHALELSNVKLNLEENQEGIKNWEFHPYKKSDILSEKNKKKNKKKWTVNFRT
ncbi:MAG: AsmA family protein, partial [Commensalibacter sp.]|nr:AsmA family protein [Commensalibacter sp.]